MSSGNNNKELVQYSMCGIQMEKQVCPYPVGGKQVLDLF